jgi:hypothetical protein
MILKFIRKYRMLFVFFIASTICIFLIEFPLRNIPESWEYGSETGKVIYDISIGYIVSYIFFYLVVFRKDENDKKNINRRVSREASLIIIEGYSIFNNLTNKIVNKKIISFPPTIEQVEKYCSECDPFHSPFQVNNRQNVPWMELLRYRKQDTKNYLVKIFQLLPYLDSELVGILTRLEDSGLFYYIDHLIVPTVQTEYFKDLTTMKSSFHEYFLIMEELENYCNSYLTEFSEHKKLREERKFI